MKMMAIPHRPPSPITLPIRARSRVRMRRREAPRRTGGGGRGRGAAAEEGHGEGDILFIQMNKDPIRAGEIIVYNVDEKEIPIVHRVIKVHERRDSEDVFLLTKGDNNPIDDIVMYAPGQHWLEQRHIMGRAVRVLRYMGWGTIIINENPIMKYVLFGVAGLMYIILPKD